jgi:signal transduction histidine kinase
MQRGLYGFFSGLYPRKVIGMSAVAEIVQNVDRDERFLQLMKDAPVALAVLQKPDRLKAFNPAFERLLDLTSIRKPSLFVDLIPIQNRQEAEDLLSELFQGSRDRFQFETRSSGSESRLLRWVAWLAHLPENNVDCVLLTVEDLSEVALAEQRLRQAEKLETVGRLAGGVAHDFNNVMTGVLLYCDLLISVLDHGHRARSYADEIRQAGIQATGLARQLLSIARQTKPSPSPRLSMKSPRGCRIS